MIGEQRNHHRKIPTNNSRNIIGRNPSMVIPLLVNHDLTPMLRTLGYGNTNSGNKSGQGRGGLNAGGHHLLHQINAMNVFATFSAWMEGGACLHEGAL